LGEKSVSNIHMYNCCAWRYKIRFIVFASKLHMAYRKKWTSVAMNMNKVSQEHCVCMAG
jgi:hypothetical protein